MPKEKLFRILIFSEVGVAILYFIVDFSTRSKLPQVLQDYNEQTFVDAISEIQIILGIIGLVYLVAIITAIIGMLFWWKPARLIYTICWALVLPLSYFGDPFVTSNFAGGFELLMTGISGAILYMLWFSEIKNKFEQSRSSNSLQPTASTLG